MLRTSAFTITILGLGATAVAGQLHVPQQYATIQGAIAAAGDGDEVLVAPGVYHEAVDFLGKAITLRSETGPENTVIDASDLQSSAVKFVNYECEDTVLEGFTLTGGVGTLDGYDRYGGGAWIRMSGPVVRDCIFLENTARYGGGIGCMMSWSTIEDCRFIGNTATGMGSCGGGGIGGQSGDLVIVNCDFRGNAAPNGKGGGINVAGGEHAVTNCAFFANSALYGGAVTNVGGDLDLLNCTASGNWADAAYGGVLSIYDEAATTIVNCVIWGNGEYEVAEALDAANTRVSFSDVRGGWDGQGERNIDADPMFVDAPGGDLRLICESPCIDAGDTGEFLLLGLDCDLDGNPRPVDGPEGGGFVLRPRRLTWLNYLAPRVDMGAYEVQP
ncbi:MAG: right-handed parallel beta-helix repeat-containing protein [Planctomycetota bacterium]|nr:right-handed parallel beta-helix repeat-containing protein [Planctomycetota bacterium]